MADFDPHGDVLERIGGAGDGYGPPEKYIRWLRWAIGGAAIAAVFAFRLWWSYQ